ncbi:MULTISPECIES: CbtA family protein [unclassified Methylibium]|uniref:CbtA family protein n=1 Tax=unclassified Methylibium TaxID=2633235 RepID=UPI0003F3D9DD|nr:MULTISPECIES: CbtA family protein [unclassified Methylibium]AIA99050.1 cobalt transporter subunit CbtA (proposed) [Methylibium sp. T29]EWS56364.1 cobalt transporter subunit CbtA (proposed) [Methylibium sp. T29]EWS60876.1 cobalt transporter subunit CbtA (proposed) [Methylibium sp. T29-B]MBI5270812.1 CbtA family protein [Burkholderiales bacterium]
MLFQRLIWCALVAALFVGSVQFAVQRWQAVPLILAAEVFEDQKAAPVAAVAHEHAAAAENEHHHDDAAWEPAAGTERSTWTWVANVLHAFSLALLVFVVMALWVWKRGNATPALRVAAVVSAAGWLSLHLWPSLGLPAEVPGMEVAPLHARQAWWLLAVVCSASAFATLGFASSRWRWPVAAVLLAVPFVVGAPELEGDALAGYSGEAHASLLKLGHDFIWATTWASLSFWFTMAAVAGPLFARWLKPHLLVVLGASNPASASAAEAAR